MSAAIDLYPSRVATPAAFLPRKDPVVYGSIRPGKSDPESASEIEFYDQNGYLCRPPYIASRDFKAVEPL